MKKLYKLPQKRHEKKISQSDFSEMNKDGLTSQQVRGIQSLGTYHLSCKTLPLDAFIQAYCNNDLSGLIIIGEPNNDTLQSAFNEIIFEYSGLIKSDNSGYMLELLKQIGTMEHHIIYVDYSTLYLENAYDEDIANELRGLGYSLPEFEDKNYLKSINLIRELAKRVVFDHGELVDEYNRLNKTASGKKQTEDEFYQTVAMLSKYQGYDIFKVTVFIFTQIFNNYLREMKVQEAHYEQNKS